MTVTKKPIKKETASETAYKLYVREKIAVGKRAAHEGRTFSHEEIKRHFSK